MQSHLRRPSHLNPAQVMGPFPVQAEGMPELLIDGLPDLADPRPPAPELLGPRRPARALRRAEDLGTIRQPPGLRVGGPCEALVDAIRPARRGAYACQAWRGLAAQGKERLRQGVSCGACRPNAAARDHPPGVDRQEQREACLPAEAVAPAPSGSAWPPAPAPPLRLPRGDARAVARFVWTRLGRPHVDEGHKTGHQRLRGLAHVTMALLPRGQRWQGGPQVALRRTVQAPRTATALPWSAPRQRHHRTAAEGCLGAWG